MKNPVNADIILSKDGFDREFRNGGGGFMKRKPGFVDTQNFGLDELFYADELTMTKAFPPHRHSFAEVHYIRGGRGAEIINGVSYSLSAGSMSLKMPWHVHELIPEADCPLEISKCSFRMSVLEDGGLMRSVGAPLAQRYDSSPLARIPPSRQLWMAALFSQMMEERRHANPMREEQMAALMTQVLIEFLRWAQLRPGDAPSSTANDILRLMNLRYREPDLTCAQVAQAVRYSESQVARMLESQFGLTFGELLREIRIRNACELLKMTDYPVESIGLWAGYSSRDGFHSAFLAEKGIPAAEYRSRYSAVRDGQNIRVLSSAQLYAKMIYYLHRHYGEPVTLSQTAKRFRYSESYLKRILREQGTSFPRLLEEIRVYHGRQLLLQEGRTVDAVAREAGFASPETFYRAFKRQTGLTPAEFRRRNTGSEPRQADDGKTDEIGLF